jgi:hypothetical protein
MYFHRTSLSFMSYVCLYNDRRIRLAVSCKFSDLSWDSPFGELFENLIPKYNFIAQVRLAYSRPQKEFLGG